MRPYGCVSVCFSHFWGIGVRVGFGSRPRTRTEGLTNTENTPYGVFSVLEGERQGLGIVDDKHMPVWCVFRARGARLGRALARRKKEEKSGCTLYTHAPVALPTLSLSSLRLSRPAAWYSLHQRLWGWWKGGGTSARWGRALARRKK